ncbi:SDR family oxidoreductase [Variovorax sp. J2P1-31]|uniref:SDR family oxidoreductase n=1 Tax=Variovorax sp. J2P1-31 TaxID=3053497 RepID=UPI0025775F76|nr:SDR family oxidoreductase [Variovorax sp. J2P1-31]MDM0090036.1 SDR family oxidoreductase [Variovorax sp. J22G40]MDM0148298.1 SDR family oxidoreductase [Variovorax sp. J2P1-31]
MTPKNILIVGATSGISEAVARRYAAEGARFLLVARQQDKVDIIAADLKVRGAAGASPELWDANDVAALPAVLDRAWQSLGRVDVALIAHGTLPDQRRAEVDMAYAIEHFRLNGESAIACMLGLAARFEAQGDGVLAVIGSVAGDRGRGSNYLYGAAKAAVDACASGLRARLFKKGVHVLTIKPGFVATPMTAGLDLPAKLTVSPDRVAGDIQKAIAARKDVLYTPWFWALIMLIIRLIPGRIFKRLSL